MERNTKFDRTMIALACVLCLTVIGAASILIVLPESLDALAEPALGAPWITAPPRTTPPAKSDSPTSSTTPTGPAK